MNLILAVLLAGGPNDTPVDVQVFPAEIELSTSRDRQTYVVQATYADGVTRVTVSACRERSTVS